MFATLLLALSISQATPTPSPSPTPAATAVPLSAYFTAPKTMVVTFAPSMLSPTMRMLFLAIRKGNASLSPATLNLIESHNADSNLDHMAVQLSTSIHQAFSDVSGYSQSRVPLCGGTATGLELRYRAMVQGHAMVLHQVIGITGGSADTLTYERPEHSADDRSIDASLLTLCPQPFIAATVTPPMDPATLDAVAPIPKNWTSLPVGVPANAGSGSLVGGVTLVRSARPLGATVASGEYDVFEMPLPETLTSAQRSLATIGADSNRTILNGNAAITLLSFAMRPGCRGSEIQPDYTY
ncbi:MAG: hypothetical protein ACYDA1_03525, partial [Vulcanimicrobiaceae bacterium]